MSLANMAASATERLLGALLWRLLLVLLTALFAIAALYHFTVAGTLALELQFGILYARLIVGGIYAALALVCAGTLWAIGRKTAAAPDAPPSTRAMQLAALIESVMLGYSVSRKGDKAS
jgi:type VI protein secretion system component VasK